MLYYAFYFHRESCLACQYVEEKQVKYFDRPSVTVMVVTIVSFAKTEIYGIVIGSNSVCQPVHPASDKTGQTHVVWKHFPVK